MANDTLSEIFPAGHWIEFTGHHIQYTGLDQMVASRDIQVIYVPSWKNRWELTQKVLFFHARRRLQGEPRGQSAEAIRRALEPF